MHSTVQPGQMANADNKPLADWLMCSAEIMCIRREPVVIHLCRVVTRQPWILAGHDNGCCRSRGAQHIRFALNRQACPSQQGRLADSSLPIHKAGVNGKPAHSQGKAWPESLTLSRPKAACRPAACSMSLKAQVSRYLSWALLGW